MLVRHRQLAVLIDAALIFLIGSVVRVLTLGAMARLNGEELTGLLTKWDAQYYLVIAEHGYFEAPLDTAVPVHHRTLAFFPGLPLLIRGVHAVTGLEPAAAAALVNVIAGVAMTAAAMVIARRMGAGRLGVAAVGVLVSAAPMSITFTMPYTEALFGALAFWALIALMDRRWGWAAGLILLLGFVRITAVALIVVFVLAVLIRAPRDPRAWACLAVTPWSLAGYLVWASWHSREVGGYFGIQAQGWHTGFDFGAGTLAWSAEVLTTGTEVGYLLSLAVMIAAVVALPLAWGRVPAEVWAFSAVVMAMVLLSDGIMHSRPRLLLPTVLLLAPWVVRGVDKLPRWGTALLAGAWIAFGAWYSGYMLAVFEWAI